MGDKIILHIDFDSFFASAEQQYNPKLRSLPLGITAANGRTAIIAASREAKAMGIKSPTTTWQARKICPSLICVKADFIRYYEISKKFIDICKQYSPFVEVFSIDELFMDVTQVAYLFGGVDQLIVKLKAQIKKEIGKYITVSVGVSFNKLLAKLASGKKKPDGVYKIFKENVEEVFKESKLTDICGIGSKIAVRLNMLGIYHLLQLRTVSEKSLVKEFGPHEAAFLKNVAWARDSAQVAPFGKVPQVKSIGRNFALPYNQHNQRMILQNIFELCEEIALKLRRLNKKARTVGLSLSGTRHEHGRKTVPFYMDSGDELFDLCKRFYLDWKWESLGDGMVRQMSVWVENIQEASLISRTIFDLDFSKEQLLKTVDLLNERFGHHTIRNGFLLYSPKLKTVPNGFLADKYERTLLAKSYDEV